MLKIGLSCRKISGLTTFPKRFAKRLSQAWSCVTGSEWFAPLRFRDRNGYCSLCEGEKQHAGTALGFLTLVGLLVGLLPAVLAG